MSWLQETGEQIENVIPQHCAILTVPTKAQSNSKHKVKQAIRQQSTWYRMLFESIFNLNRSKQLADKLDVLSQSIVCEHEVTSISCWRRSFRGTLKALTSWNPMHLCGCGCAGLLTACKQIGYCGEVAYGLITAAV